MSNHILDHQYIEDLTWRDFLSQCAELKGMDDYRIYPSYASCGDLKVPLFIGFCVMDSENALFYDYEIPNEVEKYISTIGEFIDIKYWKTIIECLLYHGVAIIADEKVQLCAQEFGWVEAYMAAHRGNYNNYQELASEPNL